jgi:hypothetical protein
VSTSPSTSATTTDTGDIQNGPLAKAGQDLITIYQEYVQYENNGGTGAFVSSMSGVIVIKGTNVGVDLHWNGTGDFNGYVTSLQNLGMQIQATDPTSGIVEGMLPIAQLPTVAGLSQTKSLSPMYIPIIR